MGSLVVRNLTQVLVERVCETSGDEVGLGVVRQTFTVELVLEVIEGESVVEDLD